MATLQVDVLANVATGFGLSYALGFERQLRGSVAGDRTFALVGTSAAAIAAVTHASSPQAVAGVVTGIGFIGGGVVFRLRTGSVHGVTTAATIFAAAAIGIVVGYGDLLLGLVLTAGLLLLLEIPQIPLLKMVDARTYMGRARRDPDLSASDPFLKPDVPGLGPASPGPASTGSASGDADVRS
ncbi:MAG TPA: MgtC/SapB family protein [Acidimicrobiales bacterium]|nr:MgtC/SapB family protein [Acidimicrobiales bacterium]